MENEYLKDKIKKNVEIVQKGNEVIKASVKDMKMKQTRLMSECHLGKQSLKKIIKEHNLRQGSQSY